MATPTIKALRAPTNIVLCVVGWVICVGIAAAQFAAGREITGIKASAVLVVVAYLLWLWFWSPSVTVTPATLGVRNLIRRYTIRWSAVTGVQVGLTVRAEIGARKVTLLAAPGRAPAQGGGRSRSGAIGRTAGGSLDIAYKVLQHWRPAVDRGPATTIQDDSPALTVRWLVPEIVILVVLALGAVLVLALVK